MVGGPSNNVEGVWCSYNATERMGVMIMLLIEINIILSVMVVTS